MTAKDIMAPGREYDPRSALPTVTPDLPVTDVLARLLDAPLREVGVSDGTARLGVIDQSSLLEGIGRMMPQRDECSVVTLRCLASNFSASRIALAVEDCDANLLDMLSTPLPEGEMEVTLRVALSDPSPAVRSLERYGYEVTAAHGSRFLSADVASERLMALQILLNV